MYEIFERLLKEKDVKTADVCRATGIKAPTFSDWKKGKSAPNVDKLILIAEYFGVSVQYLRTGKEREYTIEMADMDAELIMMEKRIKEYTLKMSKLSDADKKRVYDMIDRFLKEKGE